VLRAAGSSLQLDWHPAFREGPVALAIRPEKLRIGHLAGVPNGNSLRGRVVGVKYLGARAQYSVEIAEGVRLLAEVMNSELERSFGLGDEVWVMLRSEHLHVLEAEQPGAVRHHGRPRQSLDGGCSPLPIGQIAAEPHMGAAVDRYRGDRATIPVPAGALHRSPARDARLQLWQF
jgi:hypothetical protein